jgi:hypothetical protein
MVASLLRQVAREAEQAVLAAAPLFGRAEHILCWWAGYIMKRPQRSASVPATVARRRRAAPTPD